MIQEEKINTSVVGLKHSVVVETPETITSCANFNADHARQASEVHQGTHNCSELGIALEADVSLPTNLSQG